jgi:DNA-binding PucR family transcriptional regulator
MLLTERVSRRIGDQHSQVRWVPMLSPRRSTVPEPVCSPQIIQPAVGQIGRGAVEWGIEVAYELAARCVSEFPKMGSGQPAIDTIRLATELSTIQALRAFDSGSLDVERSWPEEELHTLEMVHQRVSLEQFLEAIHVGHSWLTERCMDACRQLVTPPELPDQFALMSRVLFDWVNRFAARTSRLYSEEYARWASSAAATREETVRAILTDRAVDLSAASALLGYQLENRHHVGIMVTQKAIDPSKPALLQQLSRELLKNLGASNCLIIPIGRAKVWAWGSTNSRPDARSGPLCGLPPRVSVALGGRGEGVVGFRQTHHQAEEAARVAEMRPSGSEGLIRYDDVDLIALLTAAEGDAKDFVLRELHALAGEGPHLEDLRITLLTYLDCQRRLQATASKLFIARNTVTYRLKRAEELLGHGVEVRQPQVWAALMLAQAVGLASATE